MLADISGFSQFSGDMCSKGVNGLDTLHTATNEFLGHFVDVVYRFKGDVVCFAGDALICVFRDLGELQKDTTNVSDPDQNYCLRALQCACELRKHQISNNTYHLDCHIAVTVGKITLAILGGYNDEWSYIINGTCLSGLSTCIEDAGPKQVVFIYVHTYIYVHICIYINE
jgi:class 3 adenylate cyclase